MHALSLLLAVAFPSLHDKHKKSCSDQQDDCAKWTRNGDDRSECDRNPGFMKTQCAKSCDSCDWGPGMLAPEGIFWAGGNEFMTQARAEGTCSARPATALRYGVGEGLATQICCHNRKGAEPLGSWEQTQFLTEEPGNRQMRFYDVASGKLLFVAPRGRTYSEFIKESTHHGWPSFRDEEVEEANVRVLLDGETISVDGTHLGHNLPDASGNRYCINLACVAGHPAPGQEEQEEDEVEPMEEEAAMEEAAAMVAAEEVEESYEEQEEEEDAQDDDEEEKRDEEGDEDDEEGEVYPVTLH